MNAEYLLIGTVLKPQGIRGECKIKPYAARVGLFSSWKTLFLERDGVYSPVPLKVTRIHEGFVYARLGDSASADDAEAFRGRDLYIDRAHAAPPEEGGFYIADLIGLNVETEDGTLLGTVADFWPTGANYVITVKQKNGKEVLLPYIRDCVKDDLPEEGRIVVHLMEGLL